MPPRPYTLKEKKAILDYIVSQNAIGMVRGRKIWTDYENTMLTSRTWQSLKQAFKGIMKDLRNPYYQLPDHIIREFESGSSQSPYFNIQKENTQPTSVVVSNKPKDRTLSTDWMVKFPENKKISTDSPMSNEIAFTSTPNASNVCENKEKCEQNDDRISTKAFYENKSKNTSHKPFRMEFSDASSQFSLKNTSKPQALFIMYNGEIRPVYYEIGDTFKQFHIFPTNNKIISRPPEFCCANMEKLYHSECLRCINDGTPEKKPSKRHFTNCTNIMRIEHEDKCKFKNDSIPEKVLKVKDVGNGLASSSDNICSNGVPVSVNSDKNLDEHPKEAPPTDLRESEGSEHSFVFKPVIVEQKKNVEISSKKSNPSRPVNRRSIFSKSRASLLKNFMKLRKVEIPVQNKRKVTKNQPESKISSESELSTSNDSDSSQFDISLNHSVPKSNKKPTKRRSSSEMSAISNRRPIENTMPNKDCKQSISKDRTLIYSDHLKLSKRNALQGDKDTDLCKFEPADDTIVLDQLMMLRRSNA